MASAARGAVTCSRVRAAVIFNAMLFSDVAQRVAEIRGRISDAVSRGGHGQDVRIVAVTKTHGPEAVRAAHAAGLADVGENRVQEAVEKRAATIDVPVRWHLIGHLQSNKARFLGDFDLVHSVDRMRIADAIDAWGRGRGEPMDVLIQVNVSGESTKGGFEPATMAAEADRLAGYAGLRLRGVMTMAPWGAAEGELRAVFGAAREVGAMLRAAGHPAEALSMGMSGDYEVAVEEGATLVRLGTILFGVRA